MRLDLAIGFLRLDLFDSIHEVGSCDWISDVGHTIGFLRWNMRNWILKV